MITAAGSARPYATATVTELRACACGEPHPGYAPARRDPRNPQTFLAPALVADCPACGGPAQTGVVRHVRARFVGFWGGFAEIMYAIADWLEKLASRFK